MWPGAPWWVPWEWHSQEKIWGKEGGLAVLASPLGSIPCSSPRWAPRRIVWPTRVCHLLTLSHARSHILLLPERAVGEDGIRLLSPAFLWAPDSQEPWPLLLPAGNSPVLGAEQALG